MFLSFISCLKCYPAERLHLFKLTRGISSSVQFALYYQCYCLKSSEQKYVTIKSWHRDETWILDRAGTNERHEDRDALRRSTS